MPKSINEKITTTDERIQQLLNQKKQLVQKQKATERKERTSRLCRRHGLLESYMPDLATITDEHFEMFIKRAVANDYGRDILAKIMAKSDASTTGIPPASTTRNGAGGGENPPKAAQSGA